MKKKDLDYRNKNIEQQRTSARKWQQENPKAMRLYAKKQKYQRKGWGFEPINEYFEGAHFHHIHVDGNHSVGIFILIRASPAKR